MTTPQATPSGAGFSFLDLFTPKKTNLISFGDQPNQDDTEPELTRRKSGLEAYAKRNKQALPTDFSDQVIENEMDLEKDFVTLETVNKLTELYSLAMAFYESEGNHKYKYFANKLQDLLMKPNVKEMMVRELAPSKTKEEEKHVKRLRLENKISKINAEKEAFTVVKSQEYRDRELNKVLEKNIKSQKDRLKQRLAEKKAKRAQSVTCLSDDNSSLPDDRIQDLEKELEDKPRLNDIAEVDEARYNTPPRKRGKDGQMIFFEKGKAQKTFKFDFDEDNKKPVTKGHTRRHSFHRENVVTVIAQKRTSRAQSFGTSKVPFPLDKLKALATENKTAIAENVETEEQSAVVRKETKNQTIIEDCNEDKNKSVNSVESSNSKNQVEEIVVQDDREPEHVQNVESAVFLDEEDNEETHDEHEHEHEHEHEEQPAETAQVEEIVEEKVVNEVVETEQVVQTIAEEEQVVETVVEEEQVVQTVAEEENIQEVQEVQEAQVQEQENVQAEAEVQVQVEEAAVEVQQEEPIKEEEVTEAASEQVVEEAQVKDQEETVQEPEQVPEVQEEQQTAEVQEEQVQTEVKEEQTEVQNEEPKAETEEVIEENKVETEVVEEVKEEVTENVVQEEQATTETVEEVVEPAKEEKNIRRRTDSEVADEKKLALMRQIDAEQKELLDAFTQKQAEEREEVTKKIEEKYEQKIQNMKEEMDEDEIAGAMWERALKKFNKDKETEINEALEKLGQEQAPEFDKYKKKLLQQKMFKLAELSDE